MSALPEGSVIEIDAEPAPGHEQRGRRPALVVSVDVFQQQLAMAMVCPITTHGGKAEKARNDLEVALPPGLAVSGVVLPYHIRTIDLKARNATELAVVPRATLLAVRARLKALLGI